MITKELKQSKTIIIKRSEINLNPFNPKIHTDEKVKLQKNNLLSIGYLGGVTLNRLTGNLIDGHRRIKAMDLHYKYDGSADNDYEVKVEAIELDEKSEKEQMTYMALGNTKADLDLVAEYINDIDYSKIGLNEDELESILALSEKESRATIDTIDDYILPKEKPNEASYEDKKQHMKDVKQKCKESATERQQDEDAYITLSFSSHSAKIAFCELLNYDPYDTKFIKGEDILNIIS